MRVLVTGAGGFLGGHVARRLAEAGFEVIATTRDSPIEPPESAAAARRFHTLTVDLARGALLPHSDAVVHSAATPAWTDISVDQMLSDNVIATRTLVRHAAAAKVSAFVFSPQSRCSAPYAHRCSPKPSPPSMSIRTA